MTLDEWHAVLASEPATRAQVGAIHAEFARLGFGVGDRAERLAVCAALLGREGLGSTRDLVMGEAGRLVKALRAVGDRGELPASAGVAVGQGERGEPAAEPAGVSLPAGLAFLLAVAAALGRGCRQPSPFAG